MSRAMWCFQAFLAVTAIVMEPHIAQGARILAAFPLDCPSHFKMTWSLMEALCERGHEVMVLTRLLPPAKHHPNCKPVHITSESTLKDGLNFTWVESKGAFTMTLGLLEFGVKECEVVFDQPAVSAIVRPDSGQHFDLIFTELFHADCFNVLGHRFKAPVVSISTSPLMSWGYARFGNPNNPAYVPNTHLRYTDEMGFLARLHNSLFLVLQRALHAFYYLPREQAIIEKHFGADVPRIADLVLNTSLLLVNTHPALSLPRPVAANVVEVGGMHIEANPFKDLPKVPVVALSTSPILPWGNWRFGNPDNPAYIPNMYSGTADEMSLAERMVNAVMVFYSNLIKRLYFDPIDQALMAQAFGQGLPPVREMAADTSLLFVNTFFALSLPRPFANNVIEIGGIHITKSVSQPLPKDLEQFVSGAKDGVVLFSLGSMIRTSTLPKENAAALLKAFGSLKQRVIWKWEDEAPGPVPKNVRLSKWLPQFDVLCHNNTRLFIGHGGLLSTSEAAHCGVPLLGIAMYGDQRTNLAAISKAGAGRSVPYSTLKNTDLFLKHIKELLEDGSFQENASLLSARFRDRPMSPLETAVYWTEYVIRHKGAPHLRGAARNLAWYQEALLDVIAVVVLGLAAILYILWTVLRSLLHLVRRLACSLSGSCKMDSKKKKQA